MGGRPLRLIIGVAAAVGYSLLAARTTPFTTGADAVTAVPIVVLAVGLVIAWRRRPASSDADVSGPTRSSCLWWPWLVAVGLVVAWELANDLATGSRADHPTFSSMADAVDRYWILKAVMFLLWLVLGWWVVTRSSSPSASSSLGEPGAAS